jgi:hypothetical protein
MSLGRVSENQFPRLVLWMTSEYLDKDPIAQRGLFNAFPIISSACDRPLSIISSYLAGDPIAIRGLFKADLDLLYDRQTLIKVEYTFSQHINSHLCKPATNQITNQRPGEDMRTLARYWGQCTEGFKDAVAQSNSYDLALYTYPISKMSLTHDRSFVIFNDMPFVPSRVVDFIRRGFRQLAQLPLARRSALLQAFLPIWRSLPKATLERVMVHSLSDGALIAALKRGSNEGQVLPAKSNFADTYLEPCGGPEWTNAFALLAMVEGTVTDELIIVRPAQLGKFSLAAKKEDLCVERVFRERLAKCATFDQRLGLVKETIGPTAYSTLLSDALKMACRTGYMLLVQELVLPKHKNGLTSTDLLRGLTEAFDNEEVAVVESFVASPRFTEIPALKLDNLFWFAIERRYFSVLVPLVTSKRFAAISYEILREALIHHDETEPSYDHTQFLKAVLTSTRRKNITDADLEKMFRNADTAEDYERVSLIVESGEFHRASFEMIQHFKTVAIIVRSSYLNTLSFEILLTLLSHILAPTKNPHWKPNLVEQIEFARLVMNSPRFIEEDDFELVDEATLASAEPTSTPFSTAAEEQFYKWAYALDPQLAGELLIKRMKTISTPLLIRGVTNALKDNQKAVVVAAVELRLDDLPPDLAAQATAMAFS